MRSNLEVLIDEGLGPRAEDDKLLAQAACQALLKLTAKKVSLRATTQMLLLAIKVTVLLHLDSSFLPYNNSNNNNGYFFHTKAPSTSQTNNMWGGGGVTTY